MALKGIPELVRQGNSIVFTGEVLDIYVPQINFKNKLSEYNGEYIDSIGIFLFEIKTFEEADNDKHTMMLHSMKLPININFQYSSTFKYKGKLGDYPYDEYEVFRLENGNQFMANVVIEKTSTHAVKYVKALHKGGLPKMLNYDEILQLYHKVLEITGTNLKAPSIIYEMTISEGCRSANNIKTPFRKYINASKSKSKYAYKSTNINKLAMLNSTFGGITFENINDAVLTSIERTQNNDREQPTPLEKIAKY